MTALRIAFAETLPHVHHRLAEATLGGFGPTIPADPVTEEEIRAGAASADVLIVRKRSVDDELLSALPNLRAVFALGRNPTTVNLEAAARRGVAVAAIPHPGAAAVADHALALLLAVVRRIVPGDRGARNTDYLKVGRHPALTTETSFAFNWLKFDRITVLDGRRLGLVGFGAIGQEVARRALGFGMTVRYWQRRPLSEEWNRRLGVGSAPTLEALLQTSDVLSLHVPHAPETENMIDADALDLLPEGAVLVNTARGGLVDEEALHKRLNSGRLGGAGLDVFREEPLDDHHFLADRTPNTVLSPHTGGAGAGGVRALFERVADNLRRLEAGEPLLHLVEPDPPPKPNSETNSETSSRRQ